MASFGDFNRVNTNVTALSAQLSLNKINSELGDSRLKLSTGKRINSAEDDSAGYAIATKLNSRVKGLEQALQNVSDAKSVLDIIESSYNSIMDNLIEMKRLGLQAANDTLSRSERTLIAQQIHGHGSNINDIANSTHFNGVVLNPTTDSTLTFQTGEGTSDTESITLRQVDILGLFGPVDTQLGGTQNHIDIEINITQLSHLDDDNDDRGEIAYDLIGGTQVKADGGDFKVYSGKISEAIDKLNGYLNEVGINQRSLSSKEENLTQAITANSAAHSRIMDTDFAKEQSNSIRLQILQQTATAALSQANMGPQAVLGFLGQ
jgi:flagellin